MCIRDRDKSDEDYIRFQLEQLEEAHLSAGEQEELEQEADVYKRQVLGKELTDNRFAGQGRERDRGNKFFSGRRNDHLQDVYKRQGWSIAMIFPVNSIVFFLNDAAKLQFFRNMRRRCV